MIEYKYDAWGKRIGRTGSLAATLGALNPFLYRGYVYDEETQLYYLRSRYYNPNWGRFISPDAVLGQVGGLHSHNLYCYCGNNPIALVDPDGTSSFFSWISQYTELHNEVVHLVAEQVKGETSRTKVRIDNAGWNGGPGYPDVMNLNTREVWEIKVFSPYGWYAGPRQLNNYTRSGRYIRGGLIKPEQFEWTFMGVKGTALMWSSPDCPGLVFYKFFPGKTQPVFMDNPETQKNHRVNKRRMNVDLCPPSRDEGMAAIMITSIIGGAGIGVALKCLSSDDHVLG